MIFHPLRLPVTALPARMNNPFCYEPDVFCRAAVDEVKRWITEAPPEFKAEADQGKMFGVLIVRRKHDIGFVAGYSGQLNGRSDWPGFVPAVFDYLQPDGYFKRHEAAITALNKRIEALEQSEDLATARREWEGATHETERQLAAFKIEIKREKEGRPKELTPEMIRRSQFLKAELHRMKQRLALQIADRKTVVDKMEAEIITLKAQRRQQSDALQRWLFGHFVMLDSHGTRKDLLRIFAPFTPPAGSGECCEPKLLQYAFSQGWQPLRMAMFWWGASPRDEIRHHLHFYPACNGKCKPILKWMLSDIAIEEHPLEAETKQELEWIYEDNDIAVVCKPAGMLSVPGKNGRESVLSLVCERHPEATGPVIVHRLDMATSGLLVVALRMESYLNLQRQFKEHSVEKRYIAQLERPIKANEGRISLALRPDPCDRPRQIVDTLHGKTAVTVYQHEGNGRMILRPLTGRTHQLRVHCAHPDGLNDPIKGDELYGTKADRLYLHAEALSFTHPTTDKRMTFEREAAF